jgi:hypothetical protein
MLGLEYPSDPEHLKDLLGLEDLALLGYLVK